MSQNDLELAHTGKETDIALVHHSAKYSQELWKICEEHRMSSTDLIALNTVLELQRQGIAHAMANTYIEDRQLRILRVVMQTK